MEGRSERIGLAAVSIIGVTPTVAGATMVNLAIWPIVNEWAVPPHSAQWVSSAYIAAMAMGLPVSDWVARRFGLRQTAIVFLALYYLASIWAASASNLSALVVARIFQGFCAGIIQPATLAALYVAFPAERRGVAVGLFSFATAAAAGTAPWIGGMLADGAGWRSMFMVLAIPAAVAVPLAYSFYPATTTGGLKMPMDWAGLGLLAVSLGLTIAGLHRVATWGGDMTGLLFPMIGAATGFYLFWRRELSVRDPLIDMASLAEPRMASSCLINFLLGTGLYGSTFLIPLYAQEVLRMTAKDAGLVLLPGACVLMAGTLISAKLLDQMSLTAMMSVGIAVFAASNILLACVSPANTFAAFAAIVAFGRLGLSAAHPAVHLAIMKSGTASVGQSAGLTNLTRHLGGSFGILSLTLVAHWGHAPDITMIGQTGYRRAFIASAMLLFAAVAAAAIYSSAHNDSRKL